MKRRKTDSKMKHINARLKEFSAEEIKQVMDLVFANDFMLGKNDRGKPYLEIENFLGNTEKVEKVVIPCGVQARPEGTAAKAGDPGPGVKERGCKHGRH